VIGDQQVRLGVRKIGPIPVAFRAEHELAHLIIGPDGAADEPTRRIAEGIAVRARPAVAAVDAEIDACPAERGRYVDRRSRRGLIGRQIGRDHGCGDAGQQRADQ